MILTWFNPATGKAVDNKDDLLTDRLDHAQSDPMDPLIRNYLEQARLRILWLESQLPAS